VIDLEANQLIDTDFSDVARQSAGLPVDLFASEDYELVRRMEDRGMSGVFSRVLTFDRLLTETRFIDDMRAMLQTLEDAYQHPVDTEFTATFSGPDRYTVHLVQCRPLQVAGAGPVAEPPPDLAPCDVVLRARGAVIGRGRAANVDRLVYVVPSTYGQLPIGDRYTIARLIGRVMHAEPRPKTIMLVGPGRWGTSTPSLGVPVSFAEIDTVSVLCEIVAMRDDLVPDVSLGTHFFNELVELDILYLALFPGRKGNCWDQSLVEHRGVNRLAELVPDAAGWSGVVRVLDGFPFGPGAGSLKLHANALAQQVVCYVDPER
jgi:hypothetical protein